MSDTTKTDEPIKVEVVPSDGLSPAEKAAQAETQTPENVANRNASYDLPVENVNQAAPEKK